MSTHKHINKICCVVLVLCLLLTVLFMNGKSPGLQTAAAAPGYQSRLFDTDRVHTIDIVMDDWEGFLDAGVTEEYTLCAVVIDNEAWKNVGIRAKGNTSLMKVAQYGNDRYSFKIEFDHYDSSRSYYGLDKLSLNNLIQDNTCMKDYLVYQMMGAFGVPAPLCSYAYITVNGEDWGLYLAVEGVEESFLQRNFGNDYGELYKPDSMDMGGGRGNGGGIFRDGGDFPGSMQFPGGEKGGGPGVMGADDVSLVYTDDNVASYDNIFSNAKTDVTDEDKARLVEALRRLNAQEQLEDTLFTEEVLRYFVVHNFVCNFDSYTGSMIHNYYLYEEDSRLAMIPWDYNLAFGGFERGTSASSPVNYPIDTPVSGGTVDSSPMLAWIFADEAAAEQYHRLFSEFTEEFFTAGTCAEIIENAHTLIAPYVEKDPTKFCTYEEFETGVQALTEFCALRGESVRGQLAGTIPATEEEQARQPEALVDTGNLSISDMGGMETVEVAWKAPDSSFGGFTPGLPDSNGGTGENVPPVEQQEGEESARSEAPPQDNGAEGGDAPQPPGFPSEQQGTGPENEENFQPGTPPQDNGAESGDAPQPPGFPGGQQGTGPENEENFQPGTPPEDNSAEGGDAPWPPDFANDRRQGITPENMGNIPDPTQESVPAGSWVLVGVCLAVLVAGIGVAWAYRKKV